MKRIKHGMIVGAAALLLMTGCGSNASTADLQKQIEKLEAENAELKEQAGIEDITSDSSTDDNGIEYKEAEITNYMLDTYVNLQIGYTDEFIEAAKQHIDISQLNLYFTDNRYNNDTDPIIVIEVAPCSDSDIRNIPYDIQLEVTQNNNTFTDTLYSPYRDGSTYINCHSCFKSNSTSDIMIKATIDMAKYSNSQLKAYTNVYDPYYENNALSIDYNDVVNNDTSSTQNDNHDFDQSAIQVQQQISNTGNTYGALTYKFENGIIIDETSLIEMHLSNEHSDIIAPGESIYIECNNIKRNDGSVHYVYNPTTYLRMSIVE